jgi:cytoskeletal protein CcmA (bactofilin family)
MFGQKSKPGVPFQDNPQNSRGISAVAPPARAPSPIRPAEIRHMERTRVATAVSPVTPAVAEEDNPEPVSFEPRREEKRLIVGKGIVLKGEVSACDRLVVEGSVEASLRDSDVVVIAEGGEYKGSANINEADVAGKFDGVLTARNRLIVRATGHVNGEVRYGELEVERGGRVSGDIQVANAADADGNEATASLGD